MPYIDRDKLNEAMYHEAFEKSSDFQKWDSGCWIRYKLFENVMKSIPTADVREVKHGKWERHYSRPNVFADLYWHCSVCGYKNDNQWANVYHLYCPNCGADMRKETEDE